MKKLAPNGTAVKKIRGQLERLSTQKEFAYALGVSERTLRKIENENAPVNIDIIDRMATLLRVHRDVLVYAVDVPKLVPTAVDIAASFFATLDKERLVSPGRCGWGHCNA
jgi:transcriptional regulator with XRE-family HTH domain